MRIEPLPLFRIVEMLKERQPFCFTRWGDGEWYAILRGDDRLNADQVVLSHVLGRALENALIKLSHTDVAMSRIAIHALGDEIDAWEARRGEQITWRDAGVFERALLTGTLQPLIRAMRGHDIVYLGPAHCRAISRLGLIYYREYVEMPKPATLEQGRIITEQVLAAIAESDASVLGISAGPIGKLVAQAVWERAHGQVTILDFGSIWDGFCGVYSRTYLRLQRDWPQLLKRTALLC